MAKIDDFRAQHPQYGDMDDETLAEKLHAKSYADMPYGEFRARFIGGGAAAAPQAPPNTPTTAVAGGNRPAPSLLQRAGGFVKDTAVEMGRDIAAIPQAMVVDPVRQLARTGQNLAQGRPYTPPEAGEVERSRRSAAAMTGFAGGGVGGALAKKGVAGVGSRALRMLLEGAAGGGAGGGADAAVRSGGDPVQTAAGVALGAGLGGAVGGAASRLRRGATPTPEMPTIERQASGKARNPARSVGGRLEESGPEGREVLRRVKEADTSALTEAGTANRKLRSAGLAKLTHEEDRALSKALRGRPTDAPLSERAEAVRGEARGYLGGVVPRAREAGLPTGDVGEFYFPENIPDTAHLRRGGAVAQGVTALKRLLGNKTASANPVRDDVLENMLDLGAAPDPRMAEQSLDDYIRFIESGGLEGGDAFARGLGDPTTVKAQALRRYQEARLERNPNLEMTRDLRLPFYDPSPSRVLPRYIERAERRIAEAGQYGPQGQKITSILETIPDAETRGRTTRLAKSATGMVEEHDTDFARGLEKLRRYSTTRLTPASTVLNLSQSLNSLYASDATSFAKGVARAVTRKGGDLALDSGAISESALANVKHAIKPGSDFVDKYLKGIGFSGVEKVNRRLAANVAFVYAQKMAKRLKKNPADKFARRELSALELDADAIVQKGGLDEKDLIRAAKVFVDRTQFRQREIDLPSAFTSSALGRNMSQFKGFAYQQGQFLTREIMDQWRSGTPEGKRRAVRNLTALLALAPAVGEGVGNARAILLGRERDKEGFSRYLEDLGYAGGLGLVLDMVNSLEYDPKSWILGPTFSTGAEVAKAGSNIKNRAVDKGKGPTAGEKRTLVRALPGGAMVANRAFPTEKKNPKGRPARPDSTARTARKERSQ
jgi:hypothetical protein